MFWVQLIALVGGGEVIIKITTRLINFHNILWLSSKEDNRHPLKEQCLVKICIKGKHQKYKYKKDSRSKGKGQKRPEKVQSIRRMKLATIKTQTSGGGEGTSLSLQSHSLKLLQWVSSWDKLLLHFEFFVALESEPVISDMLHKYITTDLDYPWPAFHFLKEFLYFVYYLCVL